ncbi:glycosyltransferase family 4 protein [Thalassiella azotivora]
MARADGRLSVVFLSWRDTTHPEGGGAEQYLEHVAGWLAADGCDVEIWCARHAGSGRTSRRGDVVLRHAGGRYTVYLMGLLRLLLARLTGRGPDVVVDVQNGVPFFARLVARCPVVVLVHHVHREQWGVVLGPLGARLGWWLESRVSPRVHRGCQYVAVSEVTRDELVELGVAREDVAVVHNGTAPAPARAGTRSPDPHLVVLGRLVPHKQVEHAVRTVRALRAEGVPVTLSVVGEGWWKPEVAAEVERCGVQDAVELHGFVDESTKHAVLARSWLMLAPSLKEGWGLMVVEAAVHRVPAVAYSTAGGLSESIVDGESGVLVDDEQGLLDATRHLLRDHALRDAMGTAAAEHARQFTWRGAATSFLQVLLRAAHGQSHVRGTDPTQTTRTATPTDGSRPSGWVVDVRDRGTDEVATAGVDERPVGSGDRKADPAALPTRAARGSGRRTR